ncbi:MAG: tRNA (adenosine(37)-N6)-dimethylallyltransferase MiaA [Chloroflexi bacterium]|nr:tRNA (adenosine(37)-N6)-dimethylallyltransferase MiaA [Chloroflexota bacterium]
MDRILAIVGPTAVGKSALAMHLAQRLDGEIVVADSRQVYRLMDIGTAKASEEERKLIPHHLIDVVDPDQDFNLALYQDAADRAIAETQGRAKAAILEGGTGLYVWALLHGYEIPSVPPNPELRQRLAARAATEGSEALYRDLLAKDPLAAERIDPRNLRRVIRALEVCEISGRPFSRGQGRRQRWDATIVGLTTDRDDLYRRIDERVEEMIQEGLIEEVRHLMELGYGLELPSFSSPGYREIGLYLTGQIDLTAAIGQIKTHTHHLARRQYAWFRLKDERIRWFDVGEGTGAIAEQVMGILTMKRDAA